MRRLLVALLVASLAAAALLWVVERRAEATPCPPEVGPVPESRVQSQPDDGCGHLRARRHLDAHAWLMLASALAVAVPLAWRSRWAVVGTVPALALMVYVLPVQLFLLLWQGDCGPVESYVGDCASRTWLGMPWLVLGVVAVAAAWRAALRARDA